MVPAGEILSKPDTYTHTHPWCYSTLLMQSSGKPKRPLMFISYMPGVGLGFRAKNFCSNAAALSFQLVFVCVCA